MADKLEAVREEDDLFRLGSAGGVDFLLAKMGITWD